MDTAELNKTDAEELRKEAIEHRDVVLDLRAVLGTPAGMRFIKYLFKSFDVAQMPELGLEGMALFERLGFLRAGNSIFKIASEASFEHSAKLLAEIEKERYEILYANAQIGQT